MGLKQFKRFVRSLIFRFCINDCESQVEETQTLKINVIQHHGRNDYLYKFSETGNQDVTSRIQPGDSNRAVLLNVRYVPTGYHRDGFSQLF